MTAGFQHLLLPPYKVVRTDSVAQRDSVQEACEKGRASGKEARAVAGEKEESHPVPLPSPGMDEITLAAQRNQLEPNAGSPNEGQAWFLKT